MKRKLLTTVNILGREGKSIQGISIGRNNKVYNEFIKRINKLREQQGSKNNSEVMKRIDRKDGWDDEDNSSILVESHISLSYI